MNRCQACYKTFTTSFNLKRHLDSSSVCQDWLQLSDQNKQFIEEENVLNQIEIKNLKTDDLKCPYCHQQFSNAGNYNRHFDNSTICYKWKKYDILDYLQKNIFNK